MDPWDENKQAGKLDKESPGKTGAGKIPSSRSSRGNSPENPYHPNDRETGIFYNEYFLDDLVALLEGNGEQQVLIVRGKPGSGKTGTVKRITSNVSSPHPSVPGDRFAPLYIDARKYAHVDPDDFLFMFCKEALKETGKEEFPGQIDDQSAKQAFWEDDITEFFRVFSQAAPYSRIPVVIFDEFNCLLDNRHYMLLSLIVKSFAYYALQKKPVHLLFVLETPCDAEPLTSQLNNFPAPVKELPVESVLSKDSYKALAVEPVRDTFMYDYRALQKITYLTGRNLYFQHLAGYYLFEHIKDYRNICQEEDVERVIEKFLADEHPDLEKAWEEKFSKDERIIMAALADREIFPHHEKETIIPRDQWPWTILGDGIAEVLERLYQAGIITGGSKGYFPACPFTVPLFGQWLHLKHPFVKTLLLEIGDIAGHVPLEQLMEAIESTPEERLLPYDKSAILGIAGKWTSLKETLNGEIPYGRDETVEFVKALSTLSGFHINHEGLSSFNWFMLDIRGLNIGYLDEALCFIQDRPQLEEADIDYIETNAEAYSEIENTKLFLFFCVEKPPLLDELLLKPHLNLIAVDENSLKRIIFSSNPYQAFRRIILNGLPLHKLSPYRITGPAKRTYYGPNDWSVLIGHSETKPVVAVTGARKIGKSSLLYQLKKHSPANIYCLFIDLRQEFSLTAGADVFLRALESEVLRVLGEDVDFNGRASRMFDAFKRLSEKKEIVVVIDDVDALILLDRDNRYELLTIFHDIARQNLCRFILAGFRELYTEIRHAGSPLYNLCEELHMAALDRDASLALVTGPMNSIGASYQNAADRQLILTYTGCHPNLLQYFCTRLIDHIEEKIALLNPDVPDPRVITREDIEAQVDSRYEDYVIDEIYMFFSDAREVEKLIVLLLIEDYPRVTQFSIEYVDTRLREIDISYAPPRLVELLQSLVMRFILAPAGPDSYEFAIPVFPAILGKRIDDDFKDYLIKATDDAPTEELSGDSAAPPVTNPYIYESPLDPAQYDTVCLARSETVDTVIKGTLTRGEYYVVTGPARIGKSTFLQQIRHTAGVRADCIYFDLALSPGREDVFYHWLMERINADITAESAADRSHVDTFEPPLGFYYFLEKFRPKDRKKRVILLFDGLEKVPFAAGFLRLWRKIYHDRSRKMALNKYSAIIAGAVDLLRLTGDSTSPFGLKGIVELKDFSFLEAENLIDGPFNRLNLTIEPPAVEKILYHVSGHPYFLQHVCYKLVEMVRKNRREIKEKDVDKAVAALLSESDHLDMVKEEVGRDRELKRLVKDILQGLKKKYHPYKKYSGIGSGIIIEDGTHSCSLRNKIYENYFRQHPEIFGGSVARRAGKSKIAEYTERYRIIDDIGKGAMGMVFKAEDTKLKRTVALKVLHNRLVEDARDLEQFRSEALTTASLSHRNVVTVYDIGEHDKGHFISMEFIEGTNIARMIHKKENFSLPQVIYIAGELLKALDYSHRRGVIHRDIKPGNIMINLEGEIKIVDFGIAVVRHHYNPDQSGVVFGSPGYMSPEQFDGRRVDHRSDLYSTGVTLYHILTGRLPFKDNVGYQHLHVAPPPIAQFREDIPRELVVIIDRCMEKEREERYQSANEMLDAVQSLETESLDRQDWRFKIRSFLGIEPWENGKDPHDDSQDTKETTKKEGFFDSPTKKTRG